MGPRRSPSLVADVLAGALAIGLASGCVHLGSGPASLGAGAAQPGALEQPFTLLSWNTHKRGTSGFAAELREFGADVEIVALQEVSEAAPPWSVWSDSLAERSWTLVVAWEQGQAHYATGVATASVVRPLREQPVLSPIVEPLLRTPKSALLSWIALAEPDSISPANTLLLVNLHGVNFRPAAALAAQLRDLDAALDSHSGPLIVAGDFNMWSPARREVVAAFVARHGLSAALPASETPRFDAVYVRGLEVRSAMVLPSRSSDHDAVRVELALP